MHDDRSPDGTFSQSAEAAGDRDLLARFIRQSDQRAFAEIVRRHGTLVLGVCSRVLRDRHAAEDAFQATFLVLARSASSIRRQRSLASWLHRVAFRISMRALAGSHRRREQAVPMETVTATADFRDVGELYEQQLLDEELQDLPAKYREPLVLHHLQGLSRQQVAERLGMTVATVDGRLKRGRMELKQRLLRRGVEFGTALAAIHICQTSVQAASIEPLIVLTTNAVTAATSSTATPSTVSSQAASLTTKELTLMTGSTKLIAALAISAVVVTLIGLVSGNDSSVSGAPARGTLPLLSTAASFSTERTGDELLSQADREETEQPAEGELSETSSSVDSRDETIEAVQSERPRGHYVSSPSVRRIEEALDSITSIEFPGNPLEDVVDYISLVHNIPVLLDEAALSAHDVALDTEVGLVMKGVKLRDALGILLENVNGVPLEYVIEDEVMTITTLEEAERNLETRVYDLRSLPETFSAEDVAQVVRSAIFPGSWREEGVPAGVGEQSDSSAETDIQDDQRPQASLETLADTLVVTHSQPIHREISELLDELRRQSSESSLLDRAATEPEWWIEDALDEVVTTEFPSNPLENVLDYVSLMQNVPILIDEQGLSDARVSPREKVSLVISGIRLRSALHLLLRDVGGVPLDYIVRHGTLTITTPERAERTLETRVYDMRDLTPALSPEEIAQTVRSTIRPGTWQGQVFIGPETAVGESRLQVDERFQAAIETLPDALVITQSQPIHREIAELLKQLRYYHTEATAPTATAAKPTIEDRLDELTYLRYPGARLQDVLDRITRKHGVVFLIDEPNLSAAGLSPDDQVFVLVAGVTLRSALDMLWVIDARVRLAWFVDDGMVHITTPAAAAPSISGLIRVRGDVPDLPPLVIAGDPDVRDASILHEDVPDRSLAVGDQHGLANVFVWLRSVPGGVAIPAAEQRELPLVSAQLQFFPHVLLARAGQQIRLQNAHRVAVNVRMSPMRNPPINQILAPNDLEGFDLQFDYAEDLPVRLTDDMHPFRSAFVLPLDHPFADLTDSSGRFNIRQLPPGDYELTIWHERVGYLERSLPVTVSEEGAAELDLEYDIDQFFESPSPT